MDQCPKCQYPNGERPAKGVYTPGKKCDGCGYQAEVAITQEQYIETQQQLLILSAIVRDMPLAEFLAAAERADAFGPVLDPSLWKANQQNLQTIKTMAKGLMTFQASLPPVCRRCKAKEPAYRGAIYCGAACAAQAEAHR